MNRAAPKPPLVHLQGIGKAYPVLNSRSGRLRTVLELVAGRAAHTTHRALEGIDLAIQRGESWGIIGENGAGKSTLMKIIAGVAKPSEGVRAVNGRISALLELGTGFHPEYSGRENVFVASALMGFTKRETQANLEAILEFAGIGEHIDQPIKTYSTGMVVRLGFAVATALKPDLLVTDEVLAVGDESFQKKCLRWMENYRANGGALLLCSHSMYHVQSLCDQAIWIHQGRERLRGDAYSVSQAYLAYHEEKTQRTQVEHVPAADPGVFPTMEALWASGSDGAPRDSFASGEDLVLNGIYHSPEDKPIVVMAGVVRIDLTPVFGTFSNDAGFISNRIGAKRYAFRLVLPELAVLPGRYILRGHTLDEFGLRLIDTQSIEITVTGKTRDHGLVRLAHRWVPGGERP